MIKPDSNTIGTKSFSTVDAKAGDYDEIKIGKKKVTLFISTREGKLLMIKGLAHIGLYIRDINVSKSFYTEKFGFFVF